MIETERHQFPLVVSADQRVVGLIRDIARIPVTIRHRQRLPIGARTGERIALAIAEINRCGYCLSAHIYLGKSVAKLDDAEIAANRNGTSSDPKAAAAVRFATQIALARGHVSDADVQAVKAAGYSHPEIVEIVLHVALNTLTNYVNEVAQTEIDFPVASELRAA